ncbi:MAG: bifunctional UDP-4-keto-pentose/UDP-xylose synthase [Gammaproteobacteria bacterium]
MKVLILGTNGFIGNALSEAILNTTDWHIVGMDLYDNNLEDCMDHERFEFFKGDMRGHTDWIEEKIKECDVLLPLAAIANPAIYVKDPLRIFELDFEANLHIIRLAVKHNTRVIFPSTSEVYGMCPDEFFDEETSPLVTGPIHKERWIYSTSKQLMDRVIYAYGVHKNLDYTLFRPFNWYGPKLDSIDNPNARVLTKFIGHIARGEEITLVEGGEQRRCFCYLSDSINALIKIIENKNNAAHQQIINIGNNSSDAEVSIKQLAELVLECVSEVPEFKSLADNAKLVNVSSAEQYGKGYQDMAVRKPSIEKAHQLLGWKPVVPLKEGVKKTVMYYLTQACVEA